MLAARSRGKPPGAAGARIPGSGTVAILLGLMDDMGPQPRSAIVCQAQGCRLGLIPSMYLGNVIGLVLVPDRGADLRVHPTGAVRRGSTPDRGVLRHRRLCDPERDV